MIICSKPLSIGRATREPGKAEAILRERMRLSRQSFRRGAAYEYRPRVCNRSRRVLPVVSTPAPTRVQYFARFGNSGWSEVPASEIRQFRRVVPEAEIKVRVSRA